MDLNIARERLTSVVKPDSITASQGDFLATHVAIKKLHVLNKFDILPNGGKNHSEEAVFEKYILNPHNKHQFITVYGQSGTGKSHLIRWFETRFKQQKPENEVVLFIRRSDNTLKGTIRQLLEKKEVQGIANKEIYDRLVKASVSLDENKLKDTIYHNFIIEIRNDDDERSIKITNVKRKRLEAFLNNDVVHNYLLLGNGPIERMYSKIAEHSLVDRDIIAQFKPEDFFISTDLYDDIQNAGADPKAIKMARELMADESGANEANKLADYLNQFVNDVIQRCAGIEPGDFRQIFQDIRKELFRVGKNLTLFIEDVTSFTGVDDALLDALLVEHTGMNTADNICRISSIVGTTSNYFQNNFRDNHKDRITQYIYIPNNVFDESDIFEFIGRYLNTMSLPETTIATWMNDHANPIDYPIHELKEGENWESISIESNKKLYLYPFTKNSIRYFYTNTLTRGHQTPRYIIRDIIEPVMNDILNNRENFPSQIHSIVKIDTTLNYIVDSQIKDKPQAARLMRFLSIWGDGKAEKKIKNNIMHIADVSIEILEELHLPSITLSENKQQFEKTEPEITNDLVPDRDTKPMSEVSLKNQERINNANKTLTRWTDGNQIDVSATVGTAGILRAAQGDMCAYLFTSINWQAEGISMDNISKIKAGKTSLIMFENQTKGEGFYTLPSNFESLNVISAFIRWHEYGNQSWDYIDADFDAYLVTSWSSKIKDTLVKEIDISSDSSEISYIEAAILAEMFSIILCGKFRERSLKNLTSKYLFDTKSINPEKTNHTKEWNSLVSLLLQRGADKINRDTIRQFFNIIQGDGGSMVVLDEPNLSKIFRKIKTSRLMIPDNLQTQDSVKLRRDVFAYLKDIDDRIGSVVKAEVANAYLVIQVIYNQFNTDEIDEDDILEFVSKTKVFYSEVNNTQINIGIVSTDLVNKNAKQITKAINDIGEILDQEDELKILMTFSRDPVSDLKPLVDLLLQLDTDIMKVENQLIKRKNALGEVSEISQSDAKYNEELKTIGADIKRMQGYGEYNDI